MVPHSLAVGGKYVTLRYAYFIYGLGWALGENTFHGRAHELPRIALFSRAHGFSRAFIRERAIKSPSGVTFGDFGDSGMPTAVPRTAPIKMGAVLRSLLC